jgi:hypothetical protein
MTAIFVFSAFIAGLMMINVVSIMPTYAEENR